MSASLPASGDGENSRTKGVTSHGVEPFRVKVREDAHGDTNFREECEVARRTGKAARTTAPETSAQAAAQPTSSNGENRSRRSRKQETGRNPVQVGGVRLSGSGAVGRSSLPRPPRSAAVSLTVPKNAVIT
jgi:hypothetical protein